ncbi:MAG: oligosaccharide flippase family protein [Candidatus Aenigmatarchaeota archaeon]
MRIKFFEGELIRSGTIIFLSTFLGSLIAFAANLLISNMLGPENFGNFKVIIYLFAFLPVIVDFGINSSLTKYISELGRDPQKSSHIIRWFMRIKILAWSAFALILFMMKDYIAIYFLKDASLSYLILAGIALMTFNISSSFFSSIVLGFQNFKVYGLTQFIGSALSPLLAIMLSGYGTFFMVLGWGMGILIGNIPCMAYLLRKKLPKRWGFFDVRNIFLKFSLPIYPIDLITNLFSIITPIMSLFFSQRLVGYYSFGFMFYYVAMLIPNSLSTVLFPKVSELSGLKRYDHARSILRKSFMYYTFIVIAGLMFVLLFSEWFIGAVSKDFLPSLPIFRVIVTLGFLFGYNVIYSNYLKGRGKVMKYAVFMLAQNIILMAVSIFLLSSMPA